MAVISIRTFDEHDNLLRVEYFNTEEIVSAVFDCRTGGAVFCLRDSRILSASRASRDDAHDAVIGSKPLELDDVESSPKVVSLNY